MRPGNHSAPKGRNAEGQYFRFCVNHVKAYNKSYNYFDGMADNDIGAWIKASQTGHRPTWKLGDSSWAENKRASGAKKQPGKNPGAAAIARQRHERSAFDFRRGSRQKRAPSAPPGRQC